MFDRGMRACIIAKFTRRGYNISDVCDVDVWMSVDHLEKDLAVSSFSNCR